MKAYHSETKTQQELPGEAIYMGLDLHRKSWHLTVRSVHQELVKMSLPPQWEALRKVLDRYGAGRSSVVYEPATSALAYTTPSRRMEHSAW